MRTEYPAKVLLAWGEAISGHAGLRDWLIKNGYPELGIFTFALRNKRDARKWLLENGHPHLMAVIGVAEGDKGAIAWMERHGSQIMQHLANAGEGQQESITWLMQHGHRELAMIGHRIYLVKCELDDQYKDIHRYPQE